MTFRKSFLAVLFIFAAVSHINGAQAADITSNLPKVVNYDYKSDPFTLDWAFLVKDEQTQEEVSVPVSFEEKTLKRWKEKQAHLWTALPKEEFTINASAYTAAADECGKSDGVTSSGLKVEENRTLACPPAFPFGTKISIDGVGVLRCEDRGGAIKGNHFDIYVKTKKEAFAFGRRNLTAQVIE